MKTRIVKGNLVLTLTAVEAQQWGLSLAQPKANTFYNSVIGARVPCAYGSAECVGTRFAPNGVGQFQHTTCAEGRKALANRGK